MNRVTGSLVVATVFLVVAAEVLHHIILSAALVFGMAMIARILWWLTRS